MREDPIFVECPHCGGPIRFVCALADWERAQARIAELEAALLAAEVAP